MRTLIQRVVLLVGAVLGIAATPVAAHAQKALVYCPVDVDATGCNAIVAALTGPTYPLGVDRGYDGTNGTVDLKTVDLFTYSVFVVPSLADDATAQPYAKLRDPEVVEHLEAALIGRLALWSGSPDQGASNRGMKDALIQNLAGYAAGAFATAKGPGLVALLDGSANASARYDWLRGITPIAATADSKLLIYNSVRTLNAIGAGILTYPGGTIAYDNMATFGFMLPSGAAGVSLDAVGQTGTSTGGQVVLVTVEAGNSSSAIVRTDKDDYAPGTTVVITGSGWQPGETVKLTLHEDPMVHEDRVLSAVADASGSFTNTEFAPEVHHLGVRFVLTAVGETSGKRAQTTFTDAVVLQTVAATPPSQSVVAGTTATFTVTIDFSGSGSTGCTANFSVAGLPAGATPTWSPNATGSSTGDDVTRTLNVATTAAFSATTLTIAATVPEVSGGQGCRGGTVQTTVSLTVTAANQPPTANSQSVSTLEDASTAITLTGSDSDGNPLGYQVAVGPTNGSLSGTAPNLTYTPNADFFGTDNFTFTVSDGSATSAPATVSITVDPVNDAPVFTLIPSHTSAEDAGAQTVPNALTGKAAGPVNENGQTLSLTVTNDNSALFATQPAIDASGTLTYTAAANSSGSALVTVTLADNGGTANGGVDATTKMFTITVTPVNDPPTLTDVPASATIPELAPYTFDANATDLDLPAQSLTFSLESAPSGASIDPSTGVFSWTPNESQGPGDHTFKVKVSDGTATAEQSVTLTVTEVNAAPVLAPIGNQTVNELIELTFTAAATDPDLPANSLTYSLVGAPPGASINSTSGAFSWTPTEAQGPGSYTFTVRVSDGTLTDDEEITVTVNEVNVLPTLTDVPPSATIPELAPYTFDANATDADLPGQTLTFSLVGAPAGASIDATTGAFTWTPTEAQGPGPYNFTVRVSDGVGNSDAAIAITVTEVNVAPTLGAIGDKNVNEETLLTFTAVGADTDLPANTLTYSLVGTIPAGATIDPSSGVFDWTPTEAQGPGSYTFTVRVSDGTLLAEEEITVTVAEVNKAPVVAAIAEKTVDEQVQLTFSASATDADDPANTLTYSLVDAPSGATIDPSTGAFSWTPTEAQGPGSYTFKVVATDNGSPALSGETTVKVTVNEVNEAPVLGAIGSKTIDEEAELTFTATATDPDLPANTLTYSLVGAPAGASINSSTGAFTWTPTEAQGPGSFTFTVKVTDNGTPALSDEEQITVTVAEVNKAPVVDPIAPITVNEHVAATFDANATDPDVPANGITFSLSASAPTGASIDATTGAFTWTPTEAQGPGTYTFDVVATDDGSPALTGTTSVTITVNEVNEAPVLAPIGDQTIDELTPLTFTASATDVDLPANTLSYSLTGPVPTGASINSSTGAFSWTPGEDQGPGSYTFTVKVTDNGSPALSDEETITVTVSEVNVAPVLAAIGNKMVDEETALTFTVTATDADLPANTLSFSLVGAPAGASIDATTGAFTWTPTEAQGPGSYTLTVKVTDNGTPALSHEEQITVTVNEVNIAPVLGSIGDKTVDEETALTFTATATDVDLPANALTFSLEGTVPSGATIDASTGAFSWTPTEAQGPGSYTFTVKVTDNGTPALSDEEQITIVVNEVNRAPTVATIGPKSVNEGALLTFTAAATDPDLPANGLAFSLVSPPAGASIDAATGVFTWTPADGPNGSPVSITVRVTDNGTPALSDDEVFQVTVNNVNPTATFNVPPGPFAEGQTFGISLSGALDVPADLPTLTYAFDCGTGTGYGPASSTPNATCPALDDPGQSVKGKVIDKDGGFTEYTASTTITNVAPVLGPIVITPTDLVTINSTITATASFTDAGKLDPHTGTYDWGDGSTSAAVIAESNGSGTATATHKYTATGVYIVKLTLSDGDEAGSVQTEYRYVVVYDPNAGFVTGGGWIDSPLGACRLTAVCENATGKANFGFVAKYKKGQSAPEGNTEFQFHAGNLNFKSAVYEWLVVAGSKAQYKGTGTINGTGNYGFMLMAVDGALPGSGSGDRFRIKIWDKNNGDAVVYDNEMNVDETVAPTTALGGGSIVLHSK